VKLVLNLAFFAHTSQSYPPTS